MKKLNLLLFISVLILSLVSGASASFTATADETDPFSPWDAVTAGATTSSPSWDGTNYYIAAPAGASMYKNFTTTQNYWAFDMNSNNPGAIISDVYFRRDSTGANSCIMEFASAPASLVVSTAGFGNCAGLVNINYPLVKNQWYTFRITDLGSSLRFDILNTTNGTTVKTQTIADIPGASSTFIQFAMNQNAFKYDNIFVSTVAASTSTTIDWANSEIIQGINAPFTWSISNTDWSTWSCGIGGILPCTWRVDQEFTNGQVDTTTTLLTVGQTGTYSQYFGNPGTYTINLIKSGFGGSDVTVSSDSMIVDAQSTTYFNIPTPVQIKQNVTVTYHIGVGGLFPLLQWFFLDNGVEVKENQVIIPNLDGTINITFAQVGNYNVYLKDGSVNGQTFQIQTVTTLFNEAATPTNNYPVSFINLIASNGSSCEGCTYAFNDLIDGNYGIQNTSFLQLGVFYIDLYNTDSGTRTLTYFGSGETTVGLHDSGIFGLVINNKPDVGLSGYWQPGNNSLRLMVQRPNGTIYTLDTVNFFLSQTDTAGYSLVVKPLNVIAEEQVSITVISPTTGAYITIQGNGVGITNYFKTYNFSTGTKTITTSFTTQGSYEIFLYDIAGGIHGNARVTVATTVLPTPTPQTGEQAASDVTVLLTSLTFWSFLMTAGVMMYVGWKTRSYIPASIAGMTGLGVFTWIGWVPPAIFFSVLVIVAYLLARSQVSGETDTGNNK